VATRTKRKLIEAIDAAEEGAQRDAAVQPAPATIEEIHGEPPPVNLLPNRDARPYSEALRAKSRPPVGEFARSDFARRVRQKSVQPNDESGSRPLPINVPRAASRRASRAADRAKAPASSAARSSSRRPSERPPVNVASKSKGSASSRVKPERLKVPLQLRRS
jgi:hypothetical protein